MHLNIIGSLNIYLGNLWNDDCSVFLYDPSSSSISGGKEPLFADYRRLKIAELLRITKLHSTIVSIYMFYV